ncbi:MAG TPA: SMP-30/gluconolactonase/LRE family protein [Chitinophagaceae bacterium]|nr:SMP-30/gluconolactonase/LRE family protein [Chitinophagaceae bacterium]
MKKIFLLALYCWQLTIVLAQETRQLTTARPDAVADLTTEQGAALLNAQWFVQPARIVDASFRLPGASATDNMLLYPTGATVKTHTIQPQINAPDFDKRFIPVAANSLAMRKGMGLVSLAWYKVELTIPALVGQLSTNGAVAVFEAVVDDYSEIWVNGRQMHSPGQTGNGVIAGYNNINRVVLSQHAQPGDHFSIAILGINGPQGMIPDNYIWIRSAVVDFYTSWPVKEDWKNVGSIYAFDTALNSIITPNSPIEKLADGFSFIEGPVWHPDGFLLFSDPNNNTIYRYDPSNHNVTVYMSHSGYTGANISQYPQPGSNGLAIDKEGRLIVDQHGNRRVIRHEKKGPVTVLADRLDGKRLNSPNDIVLKSDGTIYFTDPPYGLPHFYEDTGKELSFSGVFMIKEGKLTLLAKDLGGPNGLAFSPDEKYLYVTNWDNRHP